MDKKENIDHGQGDSDKKRKDFVIIVNGRERKADCKKLTFDDVVTLAFGEVSSNPNICYTVTYKRGPGQNPEGSMVEGDIVVINKGMIFNVTKTDKS
jgi:hypothetical protein